ncbi:MAG: hypothetical protein DMF68_16830 [Acidobacteria bacterium]|nr:MAG: hypothetical protein DMF68_16830 [Acidobacteriota bacterium]
MTLEDSQTYCTNDGTTLVADKSSYDPGATLVAPQPQYNPGGQQPYASPGAPPQWQQQQGGYYQQPGQYAPGYVNPYAPAATGSRALSTAAFFCGLGAFIIMVLLIVFYVMVTNGVLDLSTAIKIAQILQPLSYVMLFAGAASIVFGIVALVMSGKNPALSKAKSIIGMVLGIIPLVLFLIGMANRGY